MIDSKEYFYSLCKSKEDLDKLILYKNIGHLFESICKKYQTLPCLCWETGQKNFGQVYEDVSKLRTFYLSLNLKPSSHIGLVFRNEYDFVINFFAVTTLGFVAVNIPATSPFMAYRGLKDRFDIDVLIFSNYVKDIYNQYQDKFCDKDAYLCKDPNTLTHLSPARNDIDDFTPACIVFTGGTTSAPKGAVLSHRNLCRGALNGCFAPTKMFHIKFVSLIPFTHIFGLVKNLLTCFLTGSCLYIISNMFNFVKEMPLAKPETMVLTPALVNIVITLLKKFGVNILGGKVNTIIAGGAPVFKEMIEELLKFNINCYPGYGLTESTNLISGNCSISYKGDSVGLPYPECELKIVNGEIVVRGDNVFLGYYKDEITTKEKLKDGWLYTGDLGYIDDEGYLFVTGRVNSLIVLPSGLKFSPEEVEREINKNPLVTDSVVFFDKENKLITAEIYVNPTTFSIMDEAKCQESITKYIKEVANLNLTEFIRVQNVIFRKEDFKRSPAMKIIREHK